VNDLPRHPVAIKVYDESIRVMKSAVQKAKLGRDEEMQALRRLDSQASDLRASSRVQRWNPSLSVRLHLPRTATSVIGWERNLAAKKAAGLPEQPWRCESAWHTQR
jgi:hypothetical protein